MTPEEQAKYYEVLDWYNNLEKENKTDNLVAIINERIAISRQSIEKIALFQILGWELKKQHKFDEAAKALEEWSALEPADPLPWIALASQRLQFEENPELALEDVNRAIELASHSGNFRRHALNTRARILLRLKNYNELEKCLIEIVETKILPGQLDIGKERDFFDRIPSGSISHDTRNLFLEYLG
jgi:tetratricopeptide (TPR) repeat protein